MAEFVRMGICRGDTAVRRPARMPNPADAVIFVVADGREIAHLARRLPDRNMRRVVTEIRDAGAVIASVLKALQALEQDGLRLMKTGKTYNSTHNM